MQDETILQPVTFLGDIHGQYSALYETLNKNKDNMVIQVGDFGLGFTMDYNYFNHNTGLWVVKQGAKDPENLPERLKFIRGNHDNPETCRKYPNYLGDFGFNKDIGTNGVFYISGAKSIDADDRTQGVDYWKDEELSDSQLEDCCALFEQIKPKTVISHDCPKSINYSLTKDVKLSKTSLYLQKMFNSWQPDLWIFGHFHKVWDKKIENTQFVCLAINQARTFYI